MKSFLRRKQAQAIAALIMAIAVLAMAAGLGLSDGIASAAGAQKVPIAMSPPVSFNCQGQTVGQITQTFGFAILNKTGSGQLIANVQLRGATPNATFAVRLIQTPSGSDCNIIDGELTTDSLGNGQVNIQESALAGTTGAFVALNIGGTGGSGIFFFSLNALLS